MKSKTTAAILAFFLGGFGIHRFYLNQPGLGILCLFFFWTFVPAIIAFIDFIIFLTMDERTFNAKYNTDYFPKPYNQYVNVNNGNTLRSHSTADEIIKLYEMKERGIITQDEFELKKKLLL